jgi:hypothetical protein
VGVLNGVGICSNWLFHFILHTPLNSMLKFNSRNIKHHVAPFELLSPIKDSSFELIRIEGYLFLFSYLVT